MFCAAGIATNAGVAAAQSWFHPQMTTPKAIAIAAATTMSTVRQLQLIPLMSCTSLWCFENEQRTFTNRDLRGERRDLVAQTASAAEAERLVAERKAQTRRGDALGVAVHRQERHERADRPRQRERAPAANGADPERTATRFESDAVVARICEEEKVRGLVVEALPAEGAEQHDLGRARGDGLGDRELEVGLVLRRREFRDRDALLRESLDAGVTERVHVADDEVRRELPAFGGQPT